MPPGGSGAHRSNEVRIFSLVCAAHFIAEQPIHATAVSLSSSIALPYSERCVPELLVHDNSRQQETRENHENSVEESIRMTEDRDK